MKQRLLTTNFGAGNPRRATLAILILILTSGLINAEEPAPSKALTAMPGSALFFTGTSTMHDFTVRSSHVRIEAAITGSGEKALISALTATITVKDLKSGNEKLDKNMWKSLKEKEFPAITYRMIEFVPRPGEGDTVLASTRGTLQVAGTERPIAMDVRMIPDGSGSFTVSGTSTLLMTDFGIEPPSFMFGTLKTGNAVTISFDLILGTAGSSERSSLIH